MLTPQSIKSLSLLLMAGGALTCFSQARGADAIEVAAASPGSGAMAAAGTTNPAALPNCASTNYDGTRNLFTVTSGMPPVARSTGEPLTTKGAVLEAKDMPVNQQCILHVVRGAAQPGEITAGRYTAYFSGGGDGGAGGSQRFNGGGGGGASAVQNRMAVNLSPGDYKLTLGNGGPGGVACKDVLGGGPGYPGSPTSLVALSNGLVIAGTPGADSWKRPSRSQLEKMVGNKDGHGGSGPGKAPGGNGGFNTPARAFGATDGAPNPAPWVAGAPGDNGTGVLPVVASGIGAGGGGGAGLGNGGDGAGLNEPTPTQTRDFLPEMGGLGAGGGGGQGRETFCTAGAAGGPGYFALRRG
ncbi:MAG: hypothetical protein JWN73_3558 [Betaproteobacteria bacterium]|nr:hypothetical protein [Betaproteobacteria bacterium]